MVSYASWLIVLIQDIPDTKNRASKKKLKLDSNSRYGLVGKIDTEDWHQYITVRNYIYCTWKEIPPNIPKDNFDDLWNMHSERKTLPSFPSLLIATKKEPTCTICWCKLSQVTSATGKLHIIQIIFKLTHPGIDKLKFKASKIYTNMSLKQMIYIN